MSEIKCDTLVAEHLENFLKGNNEVLAMAFIWKEHHFGHDFWARVAAGCATPYQLKKARKEARRLLNEFKESEDARIR